MSFWENVEFLLEQKDILKKELTLEIGISESAFSKGKQRNSIPAADTALKISKFLGVSLESLLDLEPINPQTINYSKEALQIAYEFSKLSERDKKIISTLLKEMKK
jgi:transcriptional regulator with XRE-family HTH domain